VATNIGNFPRPLAAEFTKLLNPRESDVCGRDDCNPIPEFYFTESPKARILFQKNAATTKVSARGR